MYDAQNVRTFYSIAHHGISRNYFDNSTELFSNFFLDLRYFDRAVLSVWEKRKELSQFLFTRQE